MAQRHRAGLRHLNLKTRDLKRTREFYTDVLGLRVAFQGPRDMTFLCWPGGDDLLAFSRTEEKFRAARGIDHFGFSVPRRFFKDLQKRLKARGIEIEGRRGRSAIYFADPNGYQIEVYCD